MPIDTPTYDVFISYSRLDRRPAVALEEALAQRSFSNGQRVKVFRDERNLGVGEHGAACGAQCLGRGCRAVVG